MLDRNVRREGDRSGYDSLFSSVASLFSRADISVANLEGTITGNPSKTLLPNGRTTKSFIFSFATSTAAALARSGISLVSLANNHTDAYGMAGLKETKKWLDAVGVRYFGDPWNSSSTEAVISKNGITVAFVGYHAFQPGFNRVIAAVRRLSAESDFVVVMPHWGEEYAAKPSALLRERARALAAAGAGAVIGSQPQVIMEREWIGDVPVFYSLGNLLFDQYFSPDVMKGNVVALHIKKTSAGTRLDHVSIYETSLESRSGVTVDPVPVDESP
jgi:poly-gamma-glutamate synthesis protein (capsule biosynthesis protein)